MTPPIRISYVNGRIFRGVADDWAKVQAHGVDEIEVAHRVAQGHSLYWLYPEGNCWVTGEGSIGYSAQPLNEVVIEPDGTQVERHVEYMPDLHIEHVKLGWWRPNMTRPEVPGRG